MPPALLEEDKIAAVVRVLPREVFTILDFVEEFRKMYPKDWERLLQRFGDFGEKRRYTVKTYLANRLDLYSQKPDSLLRPLVPWSQGESADRRRTTPEEREVFGSRWIAVFHKRRAPRA